MEAAGISRKAWLSSNLETSRPEHVQAERDTRAGIPLDEPFQVGGEALGVKPMRPTESGAGRTSMRGPPPMPRRRTASDGWPDSEVFARSVPFFSTRYCFPPVAMTAYM
jgi:hypothetical protein